MTKRIFRTILLVALLVLLVCMGLITGVMYGCLLYTSRCV